MCTIMQCAASEPSSRCSLLVEPQWQSLGALEMRFLGSNETADTRENSARVYLLAMLMLSTSKVALSAFFARDPQASGGYGCIGWPQVSIRRVASERRLQCTPHDSANFSVLHVHARDYMLISSSSLRRRWHALVLARICLYMLLIRRERYRMSCSVTAVERNFSAPLVRVTLGGDRRAYSRNTGENLTMQLCSMAESE